MQTWTTVGYVYVVIAVQAIAIDDSREFLCCRLFFVFVDRHLWLLALAQNKSEPEQIMNKDIFRARPGACSRCSKQLETYIGRVP